MSGSGDRNVGDSIEGVGDGVSLKARNVLRLATTSEVSGTSGGEFSAVRATLSCRANLLARGIQSYYY